jgi:hypothetical protein
VEVSKRLHSAFSQIGAKPNKKQSLARLLGPAELPGAPWRILDERTWRAGEFGSAPWQVGARAAKSIVAWRSFTRPDEPDSAALWIEIVPLATPDDAREALASLPRFFLKNARDEVELLSEREVEGPTIAGADSQWCLEQVTRKKGCDTTSCKFAGGTVGACVFVLMCAGLGSGWTWEDVAALASTQADKLASLAQ